MTELPCEIEGEIPDWVMVGLEPALRDMQLPSVIDLHCKFTPWDRARLLTMFGQPARGGLLMFAVGPRFGYGGFYLPDPGDAANVTLEIAHYLQEQVFWESDEAWAQPRPQCPGHVHPASPEVVDGEAVWVCPSTREPFAVIGTIGSR